MCGIFGGIGNNVNPGIIRALALINRERGTDSIGMFDNSGKWVKSAHDPIKALAMSEFNVFIERACSKGWFIAGHTRHATHGKVTTANAHPFRYGRIIGCHNGIVQYPHDQNYTVDSQYIFDRLNQHNGNYQAALEDISGYWGLSWFDGSHFYLQAHENTVYAAKADGGPYYYSSDVSHLTACAGKIGAIVKIAKGMTIRFGVNSPEFEVMPELTVKAAKYYRSWKSAGRGLTNYGADAGGYYGTYYSGKTEKSPIGYLPAVTPTGAASTFPGKSLRERELDTMIAAAKPSATAATDDTTGATPWGYMSDKDTEDFNAMCRASGYKDADDFMKDFGFVDEFEAKAHIEDMLYVERSAQTSRKGQHEFDSFDDWAAYQDRDQDNGSRAWRD